MVHTWKYIFQIYKSTKCNDMVQTGYCPRGPFCAFAHVERKTFKNCFDIFILLLEQICDSVADFILFYFIFQTYFRLFCYDAANQRHTLKF